MADLAASAVTLNGSWTEGGTSGRQWSVRDVTLNLVAMGTVANAVPASALGLSYIVESSPFVADDNAEVYPTTPSADGSKLLFVDLANATDGTRIAPADVTNVVRGRVKGLSN